MNDLYFQYDVFKFNEKNKSFFEKITDTVDKNKIFDTNIYFFHILEPFDNDLKYLQNQNNYYKLNKILSNNNNFLIIFFASSQTDNYEYQFSNIKFCFFETSLLFFSKLWLEKLNNKNIHEIEIKPDFQKLFYTLVRNPKEHRCLLIDELSKSNLLNLGEYTWNCKTKNEVFGPSAYDFKYWVETERKIDLSTYKLNADQYLTDIFLKLKCFVNIVTETIWGDNSHFYLSEKTFVNYLIKQPFLSLGVKGQNYFSKKFGFELYDEIFDYEFDNEPLLENRVNGIIKNLNQLKDKDFKLLYNKIEDKLNYNKNQALKIIKNKEGMPKELDSIFKNEKYQNYINTDTFLNDKKYYYNFIKEYYE